MKIHVNFNSPLNRKIVYRLSKSDENPGFIRKFKFGNDDSWLIYAKDGCPYCEKAKNLLKNKNQKVEVINGVNNPDVDKKMTEIGRSDYKTWPKIFRNGEFIGGFVDLEKLNI
jgi:glutaredoxin